MAIRDLIPWRKEARAGQPLTSRSEARDLFRGMLEDFFRPWMAAPWSERGTATAPALDVSETDEEYKVTAELPGMSRDDIQVTIHNGRLTISGTKKEERKEEKENYLRVERSYGSFSRTVTLPANVDEDRVEAAFKDGVLSLRLLKAEEGRGKHVEIKGA